MKTANLTSAVDEPDLTDSTRMRVDYYADNPKLVVCRCRTPVIGRWGVGVQNHHVDPVRCNVYLDPVVVWTRYNVSDVSSRFLSIGPYGGEVRAILGRVGWRPGFEDVSNCVRMADLDGDGFAIVLLRVSCSFLSVSNHDFHFRRRGPGVFYHQIREFFWPWSTIIPRRRFGTGRLVFGGEILRIPRISRASGHNPCYGETSSPNQTPSVHARYFPRGDKVIGNGQASVLFTLGQNYELAEYWGRF